VRSTSKEKDGGREEGTANSPDPKRRTERQLTAEVGGGTGSKLGCGGWGEKNER